MSDNPLRNIPSVHELLENPTIRQLADRFSHSVVAGKVRSFLDNVRDEFHSATSEIHIPTPGELASRIADWIVVDQQPPLRPVINATGILLHTGLGRAPLAPVALQEMQAIAAGYCSLEVDVRSGERSQRSKGVEPLIRELTGAEAATVVNNNAAATVVTLAALATGREVVVSRGQLVEIGGSYRLPEVMAVSGCHMREVGTTNRTHVDDYRHAIGEETAMLLRVHPSNFAVVGFSESVSIKEMVTVARGKDGLVVVDDIGSGAVIPLDGLADSNEPVARASLEAGADLVLFSGDKLLGGPQCGIIAGRRSLVQSISQHPLSRALRVDKLTLAALAATLRLYRHPAQLAQQLPLWELLQVSPQNLKNRAERLAAQIGGAESVSAAEPVEDVAQLGGGSLPNQQIVTWCVAITPRDARPDELAQRLRLGNPSLFPRVAHDRVLLDLRTVFAHQDREIAQRFAQLANEPAETESDPSDAPADETT